jgi:hypothetical protein
MHLIILLNKILYQQKLKWMYNNNSKDSFELISFGGKNYAYIVRSNFSTNGVEFITEPNLSQQIGYFSYKKDHIVAPHIHNKIERKIEDTSETLLIREGILQVDFYNPNKRFLGSRNLYQGDLILIFYGGHGFKAISRVEAIEIKQGPFISSELDKIKFKKL